MTLPQYCSVQKVFSQLASAVKADLTSGDPMSPHYKTHLNLYLRLTKADGPYDRRQIELKIREAFVRMLSDVPELLRSGSFTDPRELMEQDILTSLTDKKIFFDTLAYLLSAEISVWNCKNEKFLVLGSSPVTCLRGAPHKVTLGVYDPPKISESLNPFHPPHGDSPSSFRTESNVSSSSSDELEEEEPPKKKKKKPKAAEICAIVNRDQGLVECERIESWSNSPEMKRLVAQKAVLTNLASWITRLEDNASMFVGACAGCSVHCLSALSKNIKGVPGRKKGQRNEKK